MGNLLDYIDQYGGYTLEEMPFSPVDGLVLCRLAYIHFEGVVDKSFAPKVPLRKAATQALSIFSANEAAGAIPSRNDGNDEKLLIALAQSRRFSGMTLGGYENRFVPEDEKQFSALTVFISPEEAFVAYRGTDNTLVGWKEDFNMTFLPTVPSQKDGAAYLADVAEAFSGALRLGGHSKGGNLAVYAAVSAPEAVKARILAVYNYDGPGFDQAFVATAEYKEILGRIATFVPQTSIIGMLLSHEEAYTVVHSTKSGLMQHNMYTWEIEEGDFVRLEGVNESSRYIDRTFKAFLSAMDAAQREKVIDALYQVVSATGVSTLRELNRDWITHGKTLLLSVKDMDKSTKELLGETLLALGRAAAQNIDLSPLPVPGVLSRIPILHKIIDITREDITVKKLTDTFTLNNGVEIPCLGFGTWQTPDGQVAEMAVGEALACGYRHIDTAAVYGNEASVGKAVRESSIPREEIFITTKLWNDAHSYKGAMKAIDESLEKMGLDTVDLYLIHWPNPAAVRERFAETLAETWLAMEEIYRSGKARAIGVSNFYPHHLDTLLKTAKVTPAVNQIRLYPGFTMAETVAYCKERSILLEAYSPLGTGKVLSAPELSPIAEKYGKSPAQVCLRWSLQMGFLPLPKSVTPERIRQNTEVFDFTLTDTEMTALSVMPNYGGTGSHPDEAKF